MIGGKKLRMIGRKGRKEWIVNRRVKKGKDVEGIGKDVKEGMKEESYER